MACSEERDPDSMLTADYKAGKEEAITEGTWTAIEEDLWSKQLLKSPIYTRGWVFQGIKMFESL